MNKKEIYNFLDKLVIWHDIKEHDSVLNMGQMTHIDLPYIDVVAKIFFLEMTKKENNIL